MQNVYRFTVPNGEMKNSASASVSWTPPPAPAGHNGRYLWTDAFGVLNFLTLYGATRNDAYLEYATILAQKVHDILGRTRDGSRRLPGASDSDPLGGGLRIGKQDAGGPDGDGQYHHYLTLWTYALNRLAVAWRCYTGHQTDAAGWNQMAIRLMEAVHTAFVYDREKQRPRMYWKVSTGLERPLTKSEGNLDPVDGLMVCRILRAFDPMNGAEALKDEMQDYQKIVSAKWETFSSHDPLDLGMALWSIHRLDGQEEWAAGLARRATEDLRNLIDSGYFSGDTHRRLAFREFGMVLGIRCALGHESDWESKAEGIVRSWEEEGVVPQPRQGEPVPRRNSGDLGPITAVMYAAALEPGGE